MFYNFKVIVVEVVDIVNVVDGRRNILTLNLGVEKIGIWRDIIKTICESEIVAAIDWANSNPGCSVVFPVTVYLLWFSSRYNWMLITWDNFGIVSIPHSLYLGKVSRGF